MAKALRPGIAIICALAFLVSALIAEPGKRVAGDLSGTWLVTSSTVGGKPNPLLKFVEKADKTFKWKWIFKKDEYWVTVNDGVTAHGTFKIDSSKSPNTIDIFPDGERVPALGIFELDGNKVRLNLAQAGMERPTEFTSKEGTRNEVWDLTRNKNKARDKDKEK
jgi:uncharacterized protein (TIGR03067 family)